MGTVRTKRIVPLLLVMFLLLYTMIPFVVFASEETEMMDIEIETETWEQSEEDQEEIIYSDTGEDYQEETEVQVIENETVEEENEAREAETEAVKTEEELLETEGQTEWAITESEEDITEQKAEVPKAEESTNLIVDYGFEKMVTVEGTGIRISAGEGVFPEGCLLKVETVPADIQEKIMKLIAEKQQDITKLFIFDIQIFDVNGEEIQPDIFKGSVQLSFEMEEASSPDAKARVYHVSDDYQIMELESIETNENISVVTEGFSMYAIAFSDREQQENLVGEICAILYQDGTLVFQNSEDDFSNEHIGIVDIYRYEEEKCPWLEKNDLIHRVDFQTEIHPQTMEYWFSDCINLEQIAHTEKIDASETESTKRMFQNCSSLKRIDLSSIKPLCIENVEGMFYGCEELEQIDFSNVNFSEQTNMQQILNMFAGCISLKEIRCNYWTIPRITNMAGYARQTGIAELNNLKKLDMAYLNTPELIDASVMFYNLPYIEEINLNKWRTPKLSSMRAMFQGDKGLRKINLDGLDTKNVTSMNMLFYGCTSLSEFGTLGITYWDTSKVTTMNQMFSGCKSLQAIDIQRWNVSNVWDVSYMFYGCEKLQMINLRNWHTESITNASNMFSGCRELKKIDLSGWYMRGNPNLGYILVTGGMIEELYMDYWTLSDIKSLAGAAQLGINAAGTKVRKLSMSYFNAPNLESAGSFFYDMSSLISLNISYWNCPKLMNISAMFWEDKALQNLDIRGFNTENVTTMARLFSGCSSLTSLDLTSLKTGKVTNMDGMFYNCTGLEMLDISSWDTSSVEQMPQMFFNCKKLKTLNVYNFHTEKVKVMYGMFSGCEALQEIDLSSFTTESKPYMGDILKGCKKLKKITLGKDFSFIGQEDGLPYPDWYQVKTEELVKNLWNSYDGKTMEGIFVREIFTTLDHDSVDLLEYESESGIITAYTMTQSGKAPVHVDTPYLLGGVMFDGNLLESNEELLAAIKAEDTSPLFLNYKNRTYVDVMNCSEAENAIWTFDVPAGNNKVFQMEIRSMDGKTRLGVLKNTEESPDIFTLYASDGEELEVLLPNARHTYADLGYTGEEKGINVKPEDFPYPEYENYITYKPKMNNYEVVWTPGHYIIDTFMPEYVDVSLVREKEMDQLSEEEDVITGYYYHTGIKKEPVDINITLMNLIRKVSFTRLEKSADTYGKLVKVDNKGNAVSGAVYQFVSEKDGKIVYGKTDSDGAITRFGLRYSDDGGKTAGKSYTPEFQEEFLATEVISPDGYYLNHEKIKVVFHIFHDYELYQETADLFYRDGVSINACEIEKSHCETCCLNAAEDGIRCLCFAFGKCSCDNCGTNTRQETIKETVFRTQDERIPRMPNTGGTGRELPYEELLVTTILLFGAGMLLTRKGYVDSDKT